MDERLGIFATTFHNSANIFSSPPGANAEKLRVKKKILFMLFLIFY
jgi:hypothetical protein